MIFYYEELLFLLKKNSNLYSYIPKNIEITINELIKKGNSTEKVKNILLTNPNIFEDNEKNIKDFT